LFSESQLGVKHPEMGQNTTTCWSFSI